MEEMTCGECGKIIEGHTTRQVMFLMEQHKLTHKLGPKRVIKKEADKDEEEQCNDGSKP